jgi:hypothetical protein
LLELLKNQTAIGKREATGLIGLGLLAFGLWVIWWPSSPVVSGTILLYVAHGGVNGIFRYGPPGPSERAPGP